MRLYFYVYCNIFLVRDVVQDKSTILCAISWIQHENGDDDKTAVKLNHWNSGYEEM